MTETLGVLLASFDPPHRGHRWIVEQLLARCPRVLLLIPARHFSKTVVPGLNATLGQRLAMLRALARRWPERVRAEVSDVVLFVDLARTLELRPGVGEVVFAMGDETRRLVRDSRRYARRLGRPWTAADDRRLSRVLERALVVDRSDTAGDAVPVPPSLRGISSTRVRATAAGLPRDAAPAAWPAALGDLLDPEVLALIRGWGLYSAAGAATSKPQPKKRMMACISVPEARSGLSNPKR